MNFGNLSVLKRKNQAREMTIFCVYVSGIIRHWTYFHENYYWHEYYDTGGHGNAIHYVLYIIPVEYKITILQSCKNNINI